MHLWLLIAISAILNFLPFVYSQQLWPLSYVALMPLWYAVLTQHASFLAGLFWGLCMAALHCSIVLSLTFTSFLSINYISFTLIFCCVVLYIALHAGALFFGAHKISNYFVSSNAQIYLRFLFYGCAISFFLIWFSDYCFWIFGRSEGFIFAHQLIPLAEFPRALQQLIHLVDLQGTIILLVFFQGACILTFLQQTGIAYGLLALFVVPWLWGMATHKNIPFLPAWHNRITYMPHSYNDEFCMNSLAARIAHDINTITTEYNSDIIIMPEDCILNNNPTLLSTLLTFNSNAHFIFGACSMADDEWYNSLYYVHNQQVKHRHDKHFLALFSEFTPSLFGIKAFDVLRKYSVRQFKPNPHPQQPFEIDNGIWVVPYICSELFYNQRPAENSNVTVLAICGTTWVPGSYVQQVFLMGAVLRAMQWQRDMIYVSSSGGKLISKYGHSQRLKQYSKLSTSTTQPYVTTKKLSLEETISLVNELEKIDLNNYDVIATSSALHINFTNIKDYFVCKFKPQHYMTMKLVIPKTQKSGEPNFFVQYDMAYPHAVYTNKPVHDGNLLDIDLHGNGSVDLQSDSERVVLSLRSIPQELNDKNI